MKNLYRYGLLFVLAPLAAFAQFEETFLIPASMRQGMVLYLPFDADKPDENLDLSEKDQVIETFSEEIKAVKGTRGKALHFGGGTGLTLKHSPDLNIRKDYTVAFWFHPDPLAVPAMRERKSKLNAGNKRELDSVFVGDVGPDVANPSPLDWAVRPHETNENIFVFTLKGNPDFELTGNGLQAASWNHVAVACHAPADEAHFEVYAYLNGKLVDKGTTYSSQDWNGALQIGGAIYGTIDELCIWNRTLDLPELLDHLKGSGGKEGAKIMLETDLQK